MKDDIKISKAFFQTFTYFRIIATILENNNEQPATTLKQFDDKQFIIQNYKRSIEYDRAAALGSAPAHATWTSNEK